MHDVRLGPPLRLSSIVTTEWRAKVRLAVRLGLVVCLALAIVGIYLETHQPCTRGYHPNEPHVWGPAHHIHDDMSPAPVVLLALLLLSQWVAHRGRMLSAILIGPITAMIAMGVLMRIILIHALGHTLQDTYIAAPALLGASALGLAQLLIEPWLALAERRALEARAPVFPGAVALKR